MLTILGAVNIDIVATTQMTYCAQDSNPAHINIGVGGVAMNYARNLSLLDESVRFVTIFADDTLGQMARQECEQWGFDISLCATIPHSRASIFVGINNPEGDLESAACDATTLENNFTPAFLAQRIDSINTSELVLFDTNLPVESISFLLDHCTAPMMVDAVSMAKAKRLVEALCMARSPHLLALKVNKNEFSIIEKMGLPLSEMIDDIYITLGAEGVQFFHKGEKTIFPALQPKHVVSTLGAGDAFLSGIAYSYLHHISYPTNIAFSQRAAIETMAVEGAVNSNLHQILEK